MDRFCSTGSTSSPLAKGDLTRLCAGVIASTPPNMSIFKLGILPVLKIIPSLC